MTVQSVESHYHCHYLTCVCCGIRKTAVTVSAWIGLSSANNRPKITAFIRRSKRTGFWSTQLDDFRFDRFDFEHVLLSYSVVFSYFIR